MVGNLEQIDGREPPCEEDRIDLLLDVAGEQESTTGHLPEKDDRDVVDPDARGSRLDGHGAGVRPQDVEEGIVHPQAVPGSKERPGWPPGPGPRREGCVAGAGPAHAGVENPPDPVPSREERDPRDVVLVRMGENDDIDPPVPRSHPRIECREEPVRVRSAVHEEAAAA
jgi:hypothetical protein